MIQELEETVGRLSSHKGVEAVLMLNRTGDILVSSGGVASSSSSSSESTTATPPSTAAEQQQKQAKYIKQLTETATKFIQCLDPDDSVSFVQVRSKQHEVMIAPHNDYILAVLQDPLVVVAGPP